MRKILAPWLLGVALLSPARAADFDGRKEKEASPAAPASIPEVRPVPADDRVWAVVSADTGRRRSQASSLGLSIEEVSGAEVAGIATAAALARLRAAGFVIQRQTSLRNTLLKSFPTPDKAYHDYAGVEAELGAIASANPGLASLVDIGQSYGGLNITAIRFNTTARGKEPSAKPGAFFVGSHHAREHLSTEVPLLLAQWLAENKAKPEVKALLESRDIYIAPLVNPDGSEFDIKTGTYRWQRKNMRPNTDGSVGTDLNRNYGSHWGESGASTDPSDDTYQGPGAFSEPETQAVRKFVTERPNLRVMASYHTYSELILYPWSYTADPVPNAPALKAFKAIAQKMGQWTGYAAQQSGEFYPSSGDTCDWAWESRGIFCFTFELTPKSSSGGGFYPGPGAIKPTFEKNIAPLLYLSGLADNPLRAAAR